MDMIIVFQQGENINFVLCWPTQRELIPVSKKHEGTRSITTLPPPPLKDANPSQVYELNVSCICLQDTQRLCKPFEKSYRCQQQR